MANSFKIRTDLALEARESVEETQKEIRGVEIDENYDEKNEVKVTRVVIHTKNAARNLGKPMGTYITLEAPAMLEADEDYHREISETLARQLGMIIPNHDKEQSVLVVGLGNREVTADALGPNVVDNLFVTRHVILEYGKAAYNRTKMNLVSSIVPGVMAATGMETAEIVKGVVEQTKPDVVIVIDALAARSTKRMNRTVQITNTGIHPGSGVGNHRSALTKESLGVPVIAIGVPTVVDAATIVNDTMFTLVTAMNQHKEWKRIGNSLDQLNEMEKYELIRELLSPNLNTMFVTPKDIDESVKRLSFTISEGLNLAFMGENHPVG